MFWVPITLYHENKVIARKNVENRTKETTTRKWLSLPFLVTKFINRLYRFHFLLLDDVDIDVLGDFGV